MWVVETDKNIELKSPIHAISLIPEAGQREIEADSKQTTS